VSLARLVEVVFPQPVDDSIGRGQRGDLGGDALVHDLPSHQFGVEELVLG